MVFAPWPATTRSTREDGWPHPKDASGSEAGAARRGRFRGCGGWLILSDDETTTITFMPSASVLLDAGVRFVVPGRYWPPRDSVAAHDRLEFPERMRLTSAQGSLSGPLSDVPQTQSTDSAIGSVVPQGTGSDAGQMSIEISSGSPGSANMAFDVFGFVF